MKIFTPLAWLIHVLTLIIVIFVILGIMPISHKYIYTPWEVEVLGRDYFPGWHIVGIAEHLPSNVRKSTYLHPMHVSVGSICYVSVPYGPIYVYKKYRKSKVLPAHVGSDITCKTGSGWIRLEKLFVHTEGDAAFYMVDKSYYGLIFTLLVMINLLVLLFLPNYLGSFTLFFLGVAIWITTPGTYAVTAWIGFKAVLGYLLISIPLAILRENGNLRRYPITILGSFLAALISLDSYLINPEFSWGFMVGIILATSIGLTPLSHDGIEISDLYVPIEYKIMSYTGGFLIGALFVVFWVISVLMLAFSITVALLGSIVGILILVFFGGYLIALVAALLSGDALTFIFYYSMFVGYLPLWIAVISKVGPLLFA